MRFAQRVFLIAGLYGLAIMPLMYFLERQIAQDHPQAITHQEFYYGFIGVVIAWQIAFLIIAYDPRRFRPLMVPAMLEKFLFVIAIGILLALGRGREMLDTIPLAAGLDAMFGVLFVMSWIKTREDS